MLTSRTICVLALILTAACYAAEIPFVGAPPATPRESAFASEPTVSRKNGVFEIHFAVKSETDATVEILDAQGRVARHLASGVLGPKAPEPFKPGTLSQVVVWDGKDNQGREMSSACTVRVGLGLKPALDRVIGGSPQNVRGAASLATGKDGTLYYMFCAGEGHHTAGETFILAFDRNGKYLRQLMPMPANLTRDQVAGTGAIPSGEKGWMPILHHGLVHTLYPNVTGSDRQGMVAGNDGKLYFVGPDGSGKMLLLRLGIDGSAGKDFVGPVIGDSFLGSSVHLALSPDGKYVYASGLVGGARWNYKPPHNVIYRGEAAGQKQFEPFIGQFGLSGSDGQLNDPRGIAVDKNGNIYVAEAAGNRVSVWSPDSKKMIGSIAVPAADMVAVHPKTGAIYVLSSPTSQPMGQGILSGAAWFGKKKLLKYNSFKDTKETASFEFPEARVQGGKSVMALDGNVEPAAIWIGAWAYGQPNAAKKIVDRGAQFELVGDPICEQNKEKFPMITPQHLSVDRNDTLLTVNGHRVNAATGEYLGPVQYREKHHKTITRYEFGEEELSPAGDNLVHRSGMGQVVRLKTDGSATVPFDSGNAFAESQDPAQIKMYGGFMHPRGLDIAANGSLYVVHHQSHFRNRHVTAVSEVGSDGKLKRYEFIKLDAPSAGVRADRKGNIYLGTTLRPATESRPHTRIDEGKAAWSADYDPTSVRGKLPLVTGSWFLTPGFWYTMCTGSVVKFSPSGGKITSGGGPLLVGSSDGDIASIVPGDVEGAQWGYFGISPMPYKGGGASAGGCVCETARFDVDGHDRLFVPEAMRFSVAVLDSNGNFICRFGEYANMDSRGKGSAVPEPAIPFGWPMAVTVADQAAYVADYTNFRVLKLKLAYTAEKSVSAGK